MTTLESTARELVAEIARTVNLTLGHREKIEKMLVVRFQPLCVEQRPLSFAEPDAKKNEEQATKILALLKERRSVGATNVELAAIALKYTSRVSELRRRPPFNYRIICTREQGRVTRYRLYPTDY
jgi:hypothetical protein